MSHDAYVFVGWALITLGIGGFGILFILGLLRHWRWARERRKRIGWYS